MATKITKNTKPAPMMLPHSDCVRCGATWVARVVQPVKCPRCQARLAYQPRAKAVA